MTKDEKLNNFYNQEVPWLASLKKIRALLKSTDLVEDVKWGMPVYTINNDNVVGVASFKQHYGLWFYQGVYLTDAGKLLRNAQEGKTKAMRHLHFTEDDNIDEKLITSYVDEAIQNARDGKKMPVVRSVKKVLLPTMLKNELYNDAQLKLHFTALTKAKQRAYADYINEAKQEATKRKRLDRCIPFILEGKGIDALWKKN